MPPDETNRVQSSYDLLLVQPYEASNDSDTDGDILKTEFLRVSNEVKACQV
jgi:hypothetical protein